AGATGATYTINPVTAGDAGTYTVVVTGICGTPVTSSSVTLGTNAAPTITTQPQSQGVCVGNNVTLNVVSSGGGLTYQWFKNGNPIAGATNNTFTITGFTAGDAANYTVGITSPCATNTTSNVATLSVNTNAAIATQPLTQVACANTPATFSVTATGSSLTYQWRKAGTPIAGATNASYTINSVTASDVASYDVVVTGPCNSVTSSAASLIMTNPPVILTQPTNQAACANGSATFTVNATGTGLTYQWFNGNTAIPGANSNTYTVNPVTVASTYKVVVTGICGTPLTSNVVNLSINQPVVITAQPTAQSVCATSNTTFSVTATGTGLTYQWRKGGVAIAGATGATYTITNTPISAAGNYDVVVTGTCNAVTSNSVALTVNPAITLTSFVGSGSVCAGSTAAFSVTATSTGALTYQWRKNGVAITGATNSTYVINSATAADAGNYDVVISGLGTCTLTTGIIAMTVTTNCVTAVPNLNADVSSVILLPNIVRQNATLQVTVRRAMKIDWTVTDARGSVVLRFTQQAVAGSTNNIPVQATQLASGVYQITGVTANGKTSVVRFVKL
ncbi:MAG: C-terminal target protein, partial [Flaviaesturariibacter sp.]|nr:C-terminal target protein [Flaviaesturariibacter sp.]